MADVALGRAVQDVNGRGERAVLAECLCGVVVITSYKPRADVGFEFWPPVGLKIFLAAFRDPDFDVNIGQMTTVAGYKGAVFKTLLYDFAKFGFT